MGFIKVRGISFYYEEKGEGLPILLIPPSGSTASTWGAFFGDLAGVGRVIAYDRRGYSRSGGKTVRSASEHTADAAAILEALEASTPAGLRDLAAWRSRMWSSHRLIISGCVDCR